MLPAAQRDTIARAYGTQYYPHAGKPLTSCPCCGSQRDGGGVCWECESNRAAYHAAVKDAWQKHIARRRDVCAYDDAVAEARRAHPFWEGCGVEGWGFLPGE